MCLSITLDTTSELLKELTSETKSDPQESEICYLEMQVRL